MASAIGQLFYRSSSGAGTDANAGATGRSTTLPPAGNAQMPWPFPPRQQFTRTYDRVRTPDGRASRQMMMMMMMNDDDDDDDDDHDDDDDDGGEW